MEVFVGTSGWSYDWNEGGNLDWYIQNSGLNAVELNASFYRFPFRNQILGWSRKGRELAWAVKVHRGVTHTHRFNEAAGVLWKRFREAFIPLDPFVDFYLPGTSPLFRSGYPPPVCRIMRSGASVCPRDPEPGPAGECPPLQETAGGSNTRLR